MYFPTILRGAFDGSFKRTAKELMGIKSKYNFSRWKTFLLMNYFGKRSLKQCLCLKFLA